MACHTVCCAHPATSYLWLLAAHQANVWIAIFGFIGNYFWTHYFFNLLGAAYTLPSHRLNGVSTTRNRLPVLRYILLRVPSSAWRSSRAPRAVALAVL